MQFTSAACVRPHAIAAKPRCLKLLQRDSRVADIVVLLAHLTAEQRRQGQPLTSYRPSERGHAPMSARFDHTRHTPTSSPPNRLRDVMHRSGHADERGVGEGAAL